MEPKHYLVVTPLGGIYSVIAETAMIAFLETNDMVTLQGVTHGAWLVFSEDGSDDLSIRLRGSQTENT